MMAVTGGHVCGDGKEIESASESQVRQKFPQAKNNTNQMRNVITESVSINN
jgi:hypothetical protein